MEEDRTIEELLAERMKETDDNWHETAKFKKYEGSAVYVVKPNGEVNWVMKKKGGKKIAEVAGGKVKMFDRNAKYTASFERKEETDHYVDPKDMIDEYHTTGGDTGYDSIQYVTRPFKHSEVVVKPMEDFIDSCWSYAYRGDVVTKVKKDGSIESYQSWYIITPDGERVEIRRFNCFFLDQNYDKLLKNRVIVAPLMVAFVERIKFKLTKKEGKIVAVLLVVVVPAVASFAYQYKIKNLE